MKKLTLSLVVLAMGLMLSTSALVAQKTNNEFKPGMFVGLNGGVNLFFGEGNNTLFGPANSVWSPSQSMGYLGRIELGYHFNSVYSLRTMLGFNQYNHHSKIMTPGVETVDSYTAENLSADFLVNLTNLTLGYDVDRKLTFSAFAGLGIAYMNDNVLTSNIGGSLFSAGLQGNWHITPQWAMNLIADMNLSSDNTNDLTGGIFTDLTPELTLGFSYSFASQDETPVQEEKLPMKDELVKETKKAEVVETKKETVVAPVIEEVEEVEEVVAPVAMSENIFFAFDKSDIENDEQKAAIATIAAYMKANPEVKVSLSGYGDRKYGSAEVNERISECRAKTVASILVEEYGIDENRLEVKWFGSTVQPYENEVAKNRVVIANAIL